MFDYMEKIHREEVGYKRCGNVMNLQSLIPIIRQEIEESSDLDELKMIRKMLLKIELPFDAEDLLPYEIPHLIQFNKLLVTLEEKIRNLESVRE